MRALFLGIGCRPREARGASRLCGGSPTGVWLLALAALLAVAWTTPATAADGPGLDAKGFSLTATAGDAQVALSWTPASYRASYRVKRGAVSGGPYKTLTDTGATAHVDRGLLNGTAYFYVVTVVLNGQEGDSTPEASATPFGGSYTIYVTGLTPEVGTTSAGYGSSTLRLASDEQSALVKFNATNLTTPETGAHIHGPADPGQNGPILFDLDKAPQQPDGSFLWTFVPVGGTTVPQILAALKAGRLYINIHTSRYPTGEIRGHFRFVNGSMTFTPPPAPPPLPPGPPTPRDAARFLTQTTWGPKLAEISYLQARGYAGWIEEQFNIRPEPHIAYLEAEEAAGGTPCFETTLESFWKQAMTRPDQLRQRMVAALSEIFVISERAPVLRKEGWGTAAWLDLLGKNAFGNFRQLLQDVTLSPTMGAFLDMAGNDKEDALTGRIPNENYAREVLQLFSIGLHRLHPDGTYVLDAEGQLLPTYGQETVVGFAHVFTGWNYFGDVTSEDDWVWAKPEFRKPMAVWANHHSQLPKRLLDGRTLPAGQTPGRDLTDALDAIFNHPNVGPFVARQLIQRFVTSNPSRGYVYRVASAFANDGRGVRGDLKAVLRAVLLDYEARSLTMVSQPGFGKQREPMIRFGNVLRAFDARAISGKFHIHDLDDPVSGIGQEPLAAPTVFNFFAPDFSPPGAVATANLVAPEFQITNETTAIGTANFMKELVEKGFGWGDDELHLDYSSLLPLAGNIPALLDRLDLLLLSGGMSAATRATLGTLLNGLAADGWTGEERVKAAVHVIVTSPDFVVQK